MGLWRATSSSGRGGRLGRALGRMCRGGGAAEDNRLVPGVLQMHDVVVAGDISDLYEVKGQLGEGQTAHVMEGVSRADRSRCALKVFQSAALHADPEASEAVELELEVLRLLPAHRLLVSLREVVATPAAVYLVMDLVAGGDLLSPIEKRGAYKETEACRIFAQIVEAVTQMHSVRRTRGAQDEARARDGVGESCLLALSCVGCEVGRGRGERGARVPRTIARLPRARAQAGVVHRDLKPENICFTRPDHAQIKLIDMGAAGFDGPDGLSELCGTPLYAAPEVTPWFYVEDAEAAARCPRYGKEVDYWSMGVALYVMLSGEAPFEQDQPVERLLADVCRGKLDFSAPRWAKARAAPPRAPWP
eukprot:3014865-Prymnesium_polylepis.1